jgi:hypothetical protein
LATLGSFFLALPVIRAGGRRLAVRVGFLAWITGEAAMGGGYGGQVGFASRDDAHDLIREPALEEFDQGADAAGAGPGSTPNSPWGVSDRSRILSDSTGMLAALTPAPTRHLKPVSGQ